MTDVSIPETSKDHFVNCAKNGDLDQLERLLIEGTDIDARSESGCQNTALIEAVKNGHFDVVQFILNKGANVDAISGWSGETALMAASEHGYEAVVSLLLEQGADPSIVDCWQQGALYKAAGGGHQVIVNMLVEALKLTNTNITHTYNQMLMGASAGGHPDLILKALGNGAQVNSVNSAEKSPLDNAINSRQLDAVNILLTNGAELSIKKDSLDEVFMKCCEVGHPALIIKCVEAGVDINLWRDVDGSYLNLSPPTPLATVCSVGLKERFITGGKKAITESERRARIAIREPYILEAAQYLISKGARVNELNPGGLPIVVTTPLIQACRVGYISLVQLLLKNGADVNSVDSYGNSALMAAAEIGSVDLMALLIEHGADIHRISRYGETAMLIACTNAQLDVVQFLYHHGGSLASVNSRTALMSACDYSICNEMDERKRLNVLTFLIDHGVNVNACDESGYTALVHAAYRGHLKLIKLLLERGADVNPVAHHGTALSFACKEGHTEIVWLLLDNGANPNLIPPHGNSALVQATKRGDEDLILLLLKYGADVNVVDGYEHSPINAAVYEGSLTIVKLLLDHGAVAKWPNSGWSLPLSRCAGKGNLEIAKTLLVHGFDPDIPNELGRTELMVACQEGLIDLARLMVTSGANIHLMDHEGRSALLEAARTGEKDLVTLLIEKGADVESRDSNGRTALIESTLGGSLDTVRILLERGANLHARNNYGITPALAAAFAGNPNILKLLVDYGANVKDRDNFGGDVLARAVYSGNYEMVRWLLDFDLDPNAKDNDGITPLMWACLATHGAPFNKPNGDLKFLYAGEGLRRITRTPESVTTILDLLITRGARIDDRDNMGMTPLMHFAWAGNSAALAELIQRGGLVNDIDHLGRTALMWSTYTGEPNVSDLLLQHGADGQAKDDNGWTVLHHAAASGPQWRSHIPSGAISMLDVVDKDGRTPLHIAAGAAHYTPEGRIRDFFFPGMNINCRDRFGRTAFMYAVLGRKLEDVTVLLYAGADPFLTDEDGKTAEELAEFDGDQFMADFVAKHTGSRKGQPVSL